MISQETLNKFKQMKLTGMEKSLHQQKTDPPYQEMHF